MATAFISPKLKIKTLQQCTKSVQSEQWGHRSLYLYFWTDFTHCSGVSNFDFERISVFWFDELNH